MVSFKEFLHTLADNSQFYVIIEMSHSPYINGVFVDGINTKINKYTILEVGSNRDKKIVQVHIDSELTNASSFEFTFMRTDSDEYYSPCIILDYAEYIRTCKQIIGRRIKVLEAEMNDEVTRTLSNSQKVSLGIKDVMEEEKNDVQTGD